MPDAGVGAGAGQQQSARSLLRDWIKEWRDLDDRIKNAADRPEVEAGVGGAPGTPLYEAKQKRKRLAQRIFGMLEEKPHLVQVALRNNFTHEDFNADDYSPENQTNTGTQGPQSGGGESTRGETGGSGGGAQGGGAGQGGGGQGGGGGGGGGNPPGRPGWKLPGVKGKDFTIVRGPKGSYVAVYKMRVGKNVIQVGVRLPRGDDALAKYGVKPGDAKTLTKAQMQHIHSLGYAEELDFHGEDRNPFEALKRSLRRQYGGQPILQDDEVMGLIISNSIYGWTPGEFENQLRNTKWYRKTNEYQRDWALVSSPKQKQDTIRQFQERVVNELEGIYGLDWVKHVDGGMKQAREWAQNIASGRWGEPGTGFEFWQNRMFDKAKGIEGTPAWIQGQQEAEEQRGYLNRPEDMFEQLRTQAMAYLGQSNGKPLVDRDTLMSWATDLVTEKRSDGDWGQFLRRQMKVLHPYFDENIAFTEQASPYKSVYESLMRTPTSWDDPMLKDFMATDAQGNPQTDRAMSLHEYELMLRNPDKNPAAWNPGTQLWDEGQGFAARLLNTLAGVS